jgi:hypothetical protein
MQAPQIRVEQTPACNDRTDKQLRIDYKHQQKSWSGLKILRNYFSQKKLIKIF